MRKHIDRALVLVAIVVVWQAASLVFGEYWFGTPWGTLKRLAAGIWSGEIFRHASYTVLEALLGFVIGGIPAVALPFLLRKQPIVTAILDPFMVGGYGAPKLALAPLFIVWFGIGIESKMALVVFTVFFIVYFSTQAGLRALDARLVEIVRVLGANERQVARHVVLPGSIPYIFTGFRIALPYAIGGAVIAEILSSNRGLGYLLQSRAMDFDTTGVFVALIATAVVALAANTGLNALERHLLRWRPPAEVTLETAAEH